MKKNLKVLQEELADCGVCSLLSIIRYYGGDANLEKLRIDTNTTSKGVTAYNLVECATRYGFDAKGIRINDFSDITLPCIAHLNINNSLSHFVVIYKINNMNVTLMDPAKGFKTISLEEFSDLFTGVIIELVPKSNIESYSNKNVIKNLIYSLIKNRWRSILGITILNILFIILSIINSFYIDFIYSINNYKLLFMIFLIITISIIFVDYIISSKSEKFKTYIGREVLKDFYNHLFRLPLKYIHLKDSGEIIKRINDLESIKDVVVNSILVMLTNTLIFISFFIVIYIISQPVFLILLISSVTIILIAIFLYRNITDKINEVITVSTEYNSKLQDYVLGLTSIHHNNVENIFLSNLNDVKSADLNTFMNYRKYIIKINSILELLFQISSLIIYTIILINIKNDILAINTIVILSLLINMINKSLNEFIQLIPGFYYTKSIINKINNFYSINYENNRLLENNDYDFDIKNLSFSYNKYNDVISNLNVRIKRGEKVIIKGESGSGKSTLCKLLAREYDDYEGSIKFGNNEISGINDESFKNQLVYSSQDEYIFNGTIRDNILMGRIIDNEIFEKIVDVCCLDRIVKKRPFKFDTYLFDGGKELSGGERELIILARALVKNTDVLILDETLSEVNDLVEDKVLSNLFEYCKDKTIIYVSHKNKKNYFKRVIYV